MATTTKPSFGSAGGYGEEWSRDGLARRIRGVSPRNCSHVPTPKSGPLLTRDPEASNAAGGALFALSECNVTCARARFLSNAAGWSGGAMMVWDRSRVALEACEFAHNAAPFNGGGIEVLFFSRLPSGWYPVSTGQPVKQSVPSPIEAHGNCSLADVASVYHANGARDGGAFFFDL